MFAFSTVSILTIVTCFNFALFLSLGLYLREQRRGPGDMSSGTCARTSEQVLGSP